MYENFIGLKEEKRDAIINAAIGEFSSKGYDAASTNAIVARAGVSKGALFHYFPSKKELFLFLCDYSMDIVRREFLDKLKPQNGDLLARYRESCIIKIKMLRKHPRLYDFLKLLMTETSPELAAAIHEQVSAAQNYSGSLLRASIDYSLFRQDAPPEKISNIILWSVEGYADKILNDVISKQNSELDMDDIAKDFDSYLDVLRLCFYN